MTDSNINSTYNCDAILRAKIDKKEARIAVVGFGFIGTVIGAVMADMGYEVVGIDVRSRAVGDINRGKTSINEPGLADLVAKTVAARKLSASTDFQVIANCDVVVVTVGTPLGENFDPDTRDLVSSIEQIAKYLKDGCLVILKSTVPPGTTDNIVRPILSKNSSIGNRFHLAFCPERLAEGRAIIEFRTIPVIVGGINRASTTEAVYFWSHLLGSEPIVVDGATAAEFVKLVDNLWIDLNVALANEVALLSEKLGVDGIKVIAAANSLPKGQGHVNILAPSIGVGGYCLTKDPWFVHHLGKSFGLDLLTPVASRNINNRMPLYSFELIKRALADQGKNMRNSKVAVLGISFKNNTGDCRFTPTKPIIENLEKSGCALEICDPWVSAEDALTVTTKSLNPSIFDTLREADCVAFFTGHADFKEIKISQIRELVKPGAVILDGRNAFDCEKIAEARALGFDYRGIGR